VRSHLVVINITAASDPDMKSSVTGTSPVASLGYAGHNPLDFNVLGTRQGPWLIRVNAVMAAPESENVSLQLVLSSLGEECPKRTRRLYAVVPASDLDIPPQRVLIADRIRQWLETTQGNGFLDLASAVAPFPG